MAYGAVAEKWLLEPSRQAVLKGSNPWALQEMGERLLEAHRRGLWRNANGEQIQALEAMVRQVDADLERGR